MISHKDKLIFVHIRKNGGTSITHILLTNITGQETKSPIFSLPQNIRDKYELNHLKHAKASTIREHLSQENWNEYYKFAFIRNPWDRTVSTYHWGKVKEKRYSKLSFYEYVKLIQQNDKTHPLFHLFQSQTSFITSLDGEIIVDDIFPFEDLQNNIKIVGSKINMDMSIIKKHNTTDNRKEYKSYYTPELRDIIYDRYKDDVQLFNYEY